MSLWNELDTQVRMSALEDLEKRAIGLITDVERLRREGASLPSSSLLEFRKDVEEVLQATYIEHMRITRINKNG
jgi:hypothetical protein